MYKIETKKKVIDYIKRHKMVGYSELKALGKKCTNNPYMYSPSIDFDTFEEILADLKKEKIITIKEISKRNKIIIQQ